MLYDLKTYGMSCIINKTKLVISMIGTKNLAKIGSRHKHMVNFGVKIVERSGHGANDIMILPQNVHLYNHLHYLRSGSMILADPQMLKLPDFCTELLQPNLPVLARRHRLVGKQSYRAPNNSSETASSSSMPRTGVG